MGGPGMAGWREVALGFVAGVLVGGATGFQLAGRPVPAPAAKAADEYGPVPGPTTAVERAVVFHAWWRRPLATEDVVEIVRLVGAGWPGEALLVHKDAGLESRPRPAADLSTPPGCLWLRLDGDHKPTRAEILEALRTALDRAYADPR